MTPTKSTTRDTLRSSFLFRTLSDNDLDTIAGLMSPRTVARNQTVFEKGDAGDAMYAVLAGRVRIVAFSEDGKEVMLNLIETGEVFGEIAALDGGPRTAHAIADSATELLSLTRARLADLLREAPDLGLRLMTVLCARLRETSATVETLAFHGLEQRLAHLLLRIADKYGQDTEEGLVLDIKLTQKDVGTLIATSRESVSKQLTRWQEQDILTMKAGRITIKDIDFIETLAGDVD
ncbi:MAG: Crp/Fnr family transcriptional regulator [Pseudomonadota bacterium]